MIHKDFSATFYFIRHGEGENNIKREERDLISSGLDQAELTQKGKTQAVATGRRLRKEGVVFNKFFCSTMPRAVQTAQVIIDQLDLSCRVVDGCGCSRLKPEQRKEKRFHTARRGVSPYG